MALLQLFEGETAEEYVDRSGRSWAARQRGLAAPAADRGVPAHARADGRAAPTGVHRGDRQWRRCDFVRAVSQELYGVPPEAVVGTMVAYTYSRDEDGRPTLRRAAQMVAGANEGEAKVPRSRRSWAAGRSSPRATPAVTARCSSGPRPRTGPALALLVDHDDDAREFRYTGSAESFHEQEPIAEVAARLGWTVASMRQDWAAVFPAVRGAAARLTAGARGRYRRPRFTRAG